jgi:hypothetical protein
MFIELGKYVDYKTQRVGCVNKATIQPPNRYTPYTINAQARMGIRYIISTKISIIIHV